MNKDIKILKDPITNESIHPVTYADAVYLNNGTRLEDNIRYLMRRVSVIGDLNKLETNEKRSIVAALNEVYKRNGNQAQYGVRFVDSNPEGIRLGDAVGLEASAYYGDNLVYNHSDFNRIFPWSNIKRCIIDDDGNILAYENEPGFRTDPKKGNIFVEIPKFYQKIVYENNTLEMWIAPYEINGDDQYWLNPAFIDDNGKELQYIYIGAYEAAYEYNTEKQRNEIFSKSNLNILGDKTIDELRDMARLQGDFKLIDIYERNIMEFLFCIEFATLNSQTIFAGKNNYENVLIADKPRKTGEVETGLDYPNMSLGNYHTNSFRYRYMENIWGNTGEFIDGLIIKDSKVYVASKSDAYGNFDLYSELCDISSANKCYFITSRFNNKAVPYIAVPVPCNEGNNESFYCDCVAYPSSNEEKAYVVGYPHTLKASEELSVLGNGLFSVNMDIPATARNKDITSRLVYKKRSRA